MRDKGGDQGPQDHAAPRTYDVGYGRPPRQYRFRKGAPSPNPSGRPKKALRSSALAEFRADFLRATAQRITIKIDGVARTMPSRRAIVTRLLNGALKGESRSIANFLALLQMFEPWPRAR